MPPMSDEEEADLREMIRERREASERAVEAAGEAQEAAADAVEADTPAAQENAAVEAVEAAAEAIEAAETADTPEAWDAAGAAMEAAETAVDEATEPDEPAAGTDLADEPEHMHDVDADGVDGVPFEEAAAEATAPPVEVDMPPVQDGAPERDHWWFRQWSRKK